METTDQNSAPMSKNEFENLMSEFSSFLQQNQKLNKPKIIATTSKEIHEEKSIESSLEIKVEEFSQIYHQKTQNKTPNKEADEKTQKAEKIVDELEKLLQTIENYHSK